MMEFFRGKVTPRDWMAVGIILGIAVLIVLGFVFVIHRDQVQELVEARQRNEQMRSQLERARQIAQDIGDLQEEVEQIQMIVDDFEQRLPTNAELSNLFGKLEELANESDLDIDITPGARSRDERKITIPYNVVAYGTFHQIVSFINRLERYERYLKISELSVEEEEGGLSAATFTLSTYVFIEPTETTAAAAANEGAAS